MQVNVTEMFKKCVTQRTSLDFLGNLKEVQSVWSVSSHSAEPRTIIYQQLIDTGQGASCGAFDKHCNASHKCHVTRIMHTGIWDGPSANQCPTSIWEEMAICFKPKTKGTIKTVISNTYQALWYLSLHQCPWQTSFTLIWAPPDCQNLCLICPWVFIMYI